MNDNKEYQLEISALVVSIIMGIGGVIIAISDFPNGLWIGIFIVLGALLMYQFMRVIAEISRTLKKRPNTSDTVRTNHK